MTYGTATITSATPAKDLMAALKTALQAGGMTFVETVGVVAGSPSADVYKSPAANNQFGSDWYLILSRASDAGLNLLYQVAEGYNSTTHLMSNYGGTGVSAIPVSGTFANPAAPVSPTLGYGGSAFLPLTTAAYTYWYSANANRLVLGVKTSVELGFYAGLYDDLLPTGTTQFPLMCAKIPTAQGTPGAFGSGSATNTGGFTREPGQSLAASTNFEACIHNGNWMPNGYVLSGSYTPSTTTAALYGNTNSLSRVMVGSGRSTVGTSDALRGLLIGCVYSSATSVAGDTITVGGKTYTRMAGPATTYGIYADQAL